MTQLPRIKVGLVRTAESVDTPIDEVFRQSGFTPSADDFAGGESFAGFVARTRGTGNPNGQVTAPIARQYHETDNPDGRLVWEKHGDSAAWGWARRHEYVNAAKWVVGDGVADDGPNLAAADAAAVAAGAELYIPAPKVAYRLATNTTLNAPPIIPRGVLMKPVTGARLTVNKKPTVGRYPWIDRSLGGDVAWGEEVGEVDAEWFTQCVLVLPAPTAKPKLVQQAGLYGGGSAPGNTLCQVALALPGHFDGALGVQIETALGPIASITPPAGGALIGVDITACFPRSLTAKGVLIYWRTQIGPGVFSVWKRATYAPSGKHEGFTVCDTYSLGQGGATHNWAIPASFDDDSNAFWVKQFVGGGATDMVGNALATPAVAPTLRLLSALPPTTQLYGMMTYLGETGETTGSPVTDPITTSSGNGGVISFFQKQNPPQGARRTRAYLSPSPDPATMRLQAEWGVGTAVIELHTYDPAGALYTGAGNAQSTLNQPQQLTTSIDASGCRLRGVIPRAYPFYTPWILPQSGGVGSVYLHGEAAEGGTHGGYWASTNVGDEMLCSFGSNWQLENLHLTDPQQRCDRGRMSADHFGGSGFYNWWRGVDVIPAGPRSIGFVIGNVSAGENAHTTSDEYNLNCRYMGNLRGTDVSASQTANIRFLGGQIGCSGGLGVGPGGGETAASSDTYTGGGSYVIYKHIWFNGAGRAMHVMGDQIARGGGGRAILETDNDGVECKGTCFLDASAMDCNGAIVYMTVPGAQNSSGGPGFYDILAMGPATIVLNCGVFSNYIFFDNYAATLRADRTVNLPNARRTLRYYDSANPTAEPDAQVIGGALSFLDRSGGRKQVSPFVRQFFTLPTTAPNDADLAPNMGSDYLDEAGNNYKVRVRKSDGTYKTVTMAMA